MNVRIAWHHQYAAQDLKNVTGIRSISRGVLFILANGKAEVFDYPVEFWRID